MAIGGGPPGVHTSLAQNVLECGVDHRPASDVVTARRPWHEALRAKLPEILLEAASVLVAVLLAFAVDEWRDAREKRQLADRARSTVVAELRVNREELRGNIDKERNIAKK